MKKEVRHGTYGPLERVAEHIKLAKRIIGGILDKSNQDKRPNETYFEEDRAFVDAVLGGGNPLVSGEDGLRVLEVLEGIKGSVDGGKVVEVRRHFK